MNKDTIEQGEFILRQMGQPENARVPDIRAAAAFLFYRWDQIKQALERK